MKMDDNELNNKQRNLCSLSYELHKYNVFIYAQIIPCGVGWLSVAASRSLAPPILRIVSGVLLPPSLVRVSRRAGGQMGQRSGAVSEPEKEGRLCVN